MSTLKPAPDSSDRQTAPFENPEKAWAAGILHIRPDQQAGDVRTAFLRAINVDLAPAEAVLDASNTLAGTALPLTPDALADHTARLGRGGSVCRRILVDRGRETARDGPPFMPDAWTNRLAADLYGSRVDSPSKRVHPNPTLTSSKRLPRSK